MDARQLVTRIRGDLAPARDRIRDHPYLQAFEERHVELGQLRAFVGEQFLIYSLGMRNLADLSSRFPGDFFLDLIAGERVALSTLPALGAAIGMSEQDLVEYEPAAGAHAYSLYTTWLAAYASETEVAAALAVNFPPSTESYRRLGQALRVNYGLTGQQAAFFDLFRDPGEDLETRACSIIDGERSQDVPERLLRRCSRLLLEYELLFWDGLYQGLTLTSAPLPLPDEAADVGE